MRPAGTAARAWGVVLLAVIAVTGPAARAAADSPTGPIELPGTGMGLDPLAPGEPEQQLEIEQPDASLKPFFQASSGWFGSDFVIGNGSTRASVTVGEGRVFVMSDWWDRVYSYDARSLAALGSFPTEFDVSRNVAFYRGELYVLGNNYDPELVKVKGQQVKVFDPSGNLRRQLALNPPGASAYTGLDVAWNEIWVSTPASAASEIGGQQVAVFDAQTGAFKGAAIQPLADKDQGGANRYWWDFALSPELNGGISDRRFFGRGAAPLAGFGTDNAIACTGRVLFGCVADNQRGIDAVWGMRWFLELNSPVVNDYDRQVTEYSIEKRKAISQPALGLSLDYPGYYLSFRRAWQPMQAQQNDALTLTDVVYSHRKARIDWDGPLTKADWVRGTKSLPYVVSDADIFVIGARGERWYEPARGFQKIELWIDGQLKATKTTPSGSFDNIDTTQYANRPGPGEQPHTIELRATLEGGRVVSTSNPELRIDNLAPTGTVVSPGQYVRGMSVVGGAVVDVHSGAGSWQLEAQRTGGTWQTVCTPDTEPDVSGAFACTWNTTNGQYPDGNYKLRARITDKSSDGGNSAYTPEINVLVDNTAPVIDNMAPDLYEDAYETVQDLVIPVGWTHTDATSGVQETTVWANTASDGSEDGAWEQIGRSSDSNDPGFAWDTGAREGGLYRFRARACDRAGNCREREWQAQMLPPDARAESPSTEQSGDIRAKKTSCSGSGAGKRCYAGEWVGRLVNGEMDLYSRTWGIGADIRTPVPVRYTGKYDFSAAWVGLGGYYDANGTLQSGITTNPSCGGSDRIIDGKRYDVYWTRIEYIDPYGQAFRQCYKKLDTGEEHRYTVDVVETTSCAKALIDGTPKFVRVPDHDRKCGRKNKRRYWINKNGHANTQAKGEVNDPGRGMGGRFFNLLFQPFETSGWQSATANTVFAKQDRGYMFRGSPDAFCVSDKQRKLCGD